MKSKILGIALFGLTLATVVYYPQLQARSTKIDPPIQNHIVANEKPIVDVVCVLDTTGSMSGLIQTAKEKIWSIATTMASAQPTPEIRIGLVAYRDRGDAYVTKVVDLSSDLDSVYAALMDFQAGGGGDSPESVNKALNDAVNKMSWSEGDQAYQVVFLVGDAPPHMDYRNDVKYPVTLKAATSKGIVINTIQSGQHMSTKPAWQEIAMLGQGVYFQVENSGNAVAVATPFDEKLSALAAKLEDTRLFYGDAEDKKAQKSKLYANAKLRKELSSTALARRDTYNATASGKRNLLGEGELVDAITSGRVELDEIEQKNLPASMQALAPAEQMEVINEQARRRGQLKQEIDKLSASRSNFIKERLAAEGGAEDSLDEKIYRAVKDQAASIGLTYDSDSASY